MSPKKGTRAKDFSIVFPDWQEDSLDDDMKAWVYSQVEKRLPNIHEAIETVVRLNKRFKTNHAVWFTLVGKPPDSWTGGYPFSIEVLHAFKKPYISIIYGINYQRLADIRLKEV